MEKVIIKKILLCVEKGKLRTFLVMHNHYLAGIKMKTYLGF